MVDDDQAEACGELEDDDDPETLVGEACDEPWEANPGEDEDNASGH